MVPIRAHLFERKLSIYTNKILGQVPEMVIRNRTKLVCNAKTVINSCRPDNTFHIFKHFKVHRSTHYKLSDNVKTSIIYVLHNGITNRVRVPRIVHPYHIIIDYYLYALIRSKGRRKWIIDKKKKRTFLARNNDCCSLQYYNRYPKYYYNIILF